MMNKTKFKKNMISRFTAVCGLAFMGGFIITIPGIASMLEESPILSDTDSEYIVSSKTFLNEIQGKEASSIFKGEASEKKDSSSTVSYLYMVKKIKSSDSDEKTDTNINIKSAQYKITLKEVKNSESKGEDSSYKTGEEEIFRAVEVAPIYGGNADPSILMHDLTIIMKYPENAQKKGIEGRVVVGFTVFKDGKVGDFKIMRSVDPELDEEAIRAIKSLPKKWKPGYIGGQPVNCYFNLPVTFKLSPSKAETK